ncbi:hypothetical protein MUK42_25058 [Musa troglodytarum]|uniref:Uncharacterized protein n=1 Tax=Musa troglodytarum TaxID=320322 RepID=A0A9E7EA18_9LILI|nr:hypothetical protein MUK42_25058 [Musa troglodytarum]
MMDDTDDANMAWPLRKENISTVHKQQLALNQSYATLRSLLRFFSSKHSPWLMIQNLSISSGVLPGTRPAMSAHLQHTATRFDGSETAESKNACEALSTPLPL